MSYKLVYIDHNDYEHTFYNVLNFSIDPIQANTDNIFTSSGRKLSITIPYDASAINAFHNNDQPNEIYPEYLAGHFRFFKDNEVIFIGMAKVTFIDIDEQNAEIQFRISDALDLWIDLAKSTNFDVKAAEQKVIHLRPSTGDYTIANFIEELAVGFPEEMRTILLYDYSPFRVNDLKINFAKYNDDWLRWTGLALPIDDPIAAEYWDVETTYNTLLAQFLLYAAGGWSWDTGDGIWRITRFVVFIDDPNGLWDELGFYGQVRYWMADIDTNNQFQIVSEITGNSKPIVYKRQLPRKLMKLKLYPESMESEVYAAHYPIIPPTSIVTENFSIVQRNWAEFYYSGDIQLNSIVLNAGSYNYARVVKAALIANRLTMYPGSSAIVIRQHITSLNDEHEAIPLTDEDMSHLMINGSLGQIDLSDMNEVNAGYLIPALDKAYSDLLGSLRKQLRFSLKTQIANTVGLLDKISIDGKSYYITSIGHPNDNGTTDIIAIGER